MSGFTMSTGAALSVAGLALVASLAACSSSSPGSTAAGDAASAAATGAAAPGSPVSGGTLTYLFDEPTTSLDPGVNPTSAVALIDRNIFDSLVVQTGPTTFKPWLATSWTISPDGLTYTFHLKTGVRFTDGTPFTAAAVKATLDHVVDPASKSQNVSLISAYKSSTVVNPSTITVTLSEPFRPFLQGLSETALGIQSPRELALPASAYKPVGTGPFMFVSWTQQKNIVLKRNPSYNSPPANAGHSGPAYLQTLNFDLVTEDATRFGALTSGQAQGIADVPATDVATLKSTPGYQVLTASAPGINYSLYLNSSNGPTSDLRVRQALEAAINVPSLVSSVYFGVYSAATNVIGPATGDYDASAAASLQGYDPAKAGQLLNEAGWTGRDAAGYRTKDGKELDLIWPDVAADDRADHTSIAQGVQAEAKQVGINIIRPSMDDGAALTALESGSYAIWDGSNERADPDILSDFFASTSTFASGGANISRVNSPQLDTWLSQAAATGDPTIAQADYAKVQADVLKNAYALPIYVAQYTLGASDKLHGVRFDPTAQPLFYDAWLSQ